MNRALLRTVHVLCSLQHLHSGLKYRWVIWSVNSGIVKSISYHWGSLLAIQCRCVVQGKDADPLSFSLRASMRRLGQWAPSILDLATRSLWESWKMAAAQDLEPSRPEPRNLWEVSVETSVQMKTTTGYREWSSGADPLTGGRGRTWCSLAHSSGHPGWVSHSIFG